MIQVLKRDGGVEEFNVRKLGVAIWRAMKGTQGRYSDALELALAVETYLTGSGWRCVSSAAIFEMAAKVLQRVGLDVACSAMEGHRQWRNDCRQKMCLEHDRGRGSQWDKAWLIALACRSWELSSSTGRYVAGQIERELLASGRPSVSRGEVLDMMNALVAALGLADAVPVRQFG